MKILVALSGGIDSSVVAHMLRAQGHELVGVRFALWSDPLAPALARVLTSKCCTTQNAARAKAVAEALGIPYSVVDLEAEFKRDVVDPFLDGHRRGETPNPCIGCNRSIKFGTLLKLADELGCEKLATGHYARVAAERLPGGETRHVLLEAADAAKDQSYYLYGLSQEQLSRVIFPLGTMRKSEVYGLAEHYGVPYDEESYRESQDLCFFPEKSPEAFLRRHLAADLAPGEIVRRDGTVVGSHEGLPLYTIGQRRGLGIGGLRVPLEVVAKDVGRNRLVVAEQGSERAEEIAVRDIRWVAWRPPEAEETALECRVRSLSPRIHGRLRYRGSAGTWRFDAPAAPCTPGQCIVLYKGEEVVGGGVIAS